MVKVLIETKSIKKVINVDLNSCRLLKIKELEKYLQSNLNVHESLTFYFKDKELFSHQNIPISQKQDEVIYAIAEKSPVNPATHKLENSYLNNSLIDKSEKGFDFEEILCSNFSSGRINIKNLFVKCEIHALNTTQETLAKKSEIDYSKKELKNGSKKIKLSENGKLETGSQNEEQKRVDLQEFLKEYESTKNQTLKPQINQSNFSNEQKIKTTQIQNSPKFLKIENKNQQEINEPEISEVDEIFNEGKLNVKDLNEATNFLQMQRLTNKTSLESNVLQRMADFRKNVPSKSSILCTSNIQAKNEQEKSITVKTGINPFENQSENICKNKKNQNKGVYKSKIEEELMESSSDSDIKEDGEIKQSFVEKSLLLKNQINNKNKITKMTEIQINKEEKNINKEEKTTTKSPVHLMTINKPENDIKFEPIARQLKMSDPVAVAESNSKSWKEVFKLNAPEEPAFERIDFEKLKTMNLLQLRLLLENKNIKFRLIDFDQISHSASISTESIGKLLKIIQPDKFEVEYQTPTGMLNKIIDLGQFFELFINKHSAETQMDKLSNKTLPAEFKSHTELIPQTPVQEKFKMVSGFKSQQLNSNIKSVQISGQNSEKQTPSNLSGSDSLRKRVYKQINYWYSDNNYYKDEFIAKHMDPLAKTMRIDLLLSFPRLKKITRNFDLVLDVLKSFESEPDCNFVVLENEWVKKKGV